MTTLTPPEPDEEFSLGDDRYVAVAAFPLGAGTGYRVPARRLSDEPETPGTPGDLSSWVTAVFVADAETPQLLPHPVDWTEVRDQTWAPLACEVRVGDRLPPARGHLGRPNTHEELLPVSVQVVLSVSYDEWSGEVWIVTRDAVGQVRTWRRAPEEHVRFDRPYVRSARARPAGPHARHPERFTGPYVSQTGAQFVLQERSSRGGRLRAGTPQFDPDKMPLTDPETGEIVPYVVVGPPRGRILDGAQLRSPAIFTASARKLPEVRQILEREGMV